MVLRLMLGALLLAAVAFVIARFALPRYELHAHHPIYLKFDRVTGDVTPCVLDGSPTTLRLYCSPAAEFEVADTVTP